jgi:hypothetical protein
VQTDLISKAVSGDAAGPVVVVFADIFKGLLKFGFVKG